MTGSGAHAHIGCTLGDVTQPIAAGPDGRFDVPGEYNITAYPVDLGIRHPARFIGTVDGRRMLLTVVLTDTAVSLGPVLLRYGEEPRMGPCPICRMPAAVSPPTTGSPVWGAHRFLAAFGPPGGGR